MSELYIIPTDGDYSDLQLHCEKAKVPVYTGVKLKDVIRLNDDAAFSFVALDSVQIELVAAYGDELVDQIPTLVLQVPGLIYQGTWMSKVPSFPNVLWEEVRERLIKTGTQANSLSDLPSMSNQRGSTSGQRRNDFLANVEDSETEDSEDGKSDF